MNMDFERKLPIPMEVKAQYPITAKVEETVRERRKDLIRIFTGQDHRLLLVIGPCSADREDAVLDYIERLRRVQEQVAEEIMIVPRIFTNKPRSMGEGYMGFLHQPDADEKPDLAKGIVAVRELHMRAVEETGFICADEILYTENYKYIDDIMGYVTVGARSVEDQQHRLTASGLEVPVGLKNPTSGDLTVMMNAIHAAQQPHHFIYRGWAAYSHGNPYAHAVLRGYTNKHGQSLPNYHYEDLIRLIQFYEERPELKNPAVIIDTNHSNSGKDPFQQPRIIREVLENCRYDNAVRKIVRGFMVESYIEDGRQEVGGGVYGRSITDACLGWDKTERMILDLAEML